MRRSLLGLLVLAALAVCASAYVRLAPIRAADWHRTDWLAAEGSGAEGGANWYQIDRPAFAFAGDANEALARLDALIRATPRTRPLAGSLDEGHLSYVTRSLLWGFPDIINLWAAGDTIHLHSQSVYGRGDLGVNRARIEGWLAALGG